MGLAEHNAAKIAREFSIDTRIESVRLNDQTYHRVLGPVLSRSQAQKIILRARLSGYAGAWFLPQSTSQQKALSLSTTQPVTSPARSIILKKPDPLEREPNSEDGGVEPDEQPLLSVSKPIEVRAESSRFSNFELMYLCLLA